MRSNHRMTAAIRYFMRRGCARQPRPGAADRRGGRAILSRILTILTSFQDRDMTQTLFAFSLVECTGGPRGARTQNENRVSPGEPSGSDRKATWERFGDSPRRAAELTQGKALVQQVFQI
jgi:hypothetical protein